MNKIILHEFNPVIYPFKIWICITKDVQAILDENFVDYATNEPIKWGERNSSMSDAVTFAVTKKDTRNFGTFIAFKGKNTMSVSNIAHESSHAAKDLFNHIGADVEAHEPFEYLLGWIAQCCEEVKLNKLKA